MYRNADGTVTMTEAELAALLWDMGDEARATNADVLVDLADNITRKAVERARKGD